MVIDWCFGHLGHVHQLEPESVVGHDAAGELLANMRRYTPFASRKAHAQQKTQITI